MQDNTIDYYNRLRHKNLSPEERETQNFGKEKENLLRDLSGYIDPERLKRIKMLPFEKLDILLFLIEYGRINLNQIKDLFSYTKSLTEPEGYISYHERRRMKQQLQKQREEERQRRSAPPPEEQVDPVEFKNFIQKFTKSFK